MAEKGRSRGAAILVAAAVLTAAILAYELGRRGRTAEVPARPDAPSVETAVPLAEASPEPPPGAEPTPTESRQGTQISTVFEKPLAPAQPPELPPVEPAPAPEPAAAWPQRGERRDAHGCLRLDVTPTSVDAHRGAGPMVQVTVRAYNSCAFSFEGSRVAFRVSATSPDNFELANAVGRFPGELQPYASAQTTVDLLCDATRVARYRVELF